MKHHLYHPSSANHQQGLEGVEPEAAAPERQEDSATAKLASAANEQTNLIQAD